MPRKKRPSRWWWIGTLHGGSWKSLPESPIFPTEDEAREWATEFAAQCPSAVGPGVDLVPQEVEIAEVVR